MQNPKSKIKRVLGINGSARKEGNTDILLDKVLEGASSRGAEIEKIFLSELDISPCVESECEEVASDGSSIIDDDFNSIYHKIDESDVVIIASPIYFGTVSAQTKAMIDRFQCVWLAKNFKGMKDVFNKKKAGAFLCVSSVHRKDFFDSAKGVVRHLFATLGIGCKEELFFEGLDAKGVVKGHGDLLDKAYEAGKRLAG